MKTLSLTEYIKRMSRVLMLSGHIREMSVWLFTCKFVFLFDTKSFLVRESVAEIFQPATSMMQVLFWIMLSDQPHIRQTYHHMLHHPALAKSTVSESWYFYFTSSPREVVNFIPNVVLKEACWIIDPNNCPEKSPFSIWNNVVKLFLKNTNKRT